MSFPPLAIQVAVAVLAVLAGIYDLRFRRIPNWMTVSGFAAGLALNGYLAGWGGLLLSLKGGALAFAVYFVLYLARGMGAGDVKLMAAVGALVGAGNWLGIVFVTVILGAVIGLVLVTAQGRLKKTFSNLGYLLKQLLHRQLPYMKSEELDVRSGKAFGMPHGAIVMIGVFLFLWAAWTWAPRPEAGPGASRFELNHPIEGVGEIRTTWGHFQVHRDFGAVAGTNQAEAPA